MSEEYPRAISFVNSYCALVDGLAPGLEDRLSRRVVLDWFGKTIRGKDNVTAFMKSHKVYSRHIFTDIKPSPSIGYGKRRSVGKPPEKNDHASQEGEGTSDSKTSSPLDFKNDLADLKNNNSIDQKMEDMSLQDADGNQADEREKTCELDEFDLSALFRMEISSTNIEEIEESIEKIKIEETKTSIAEMECDGPGVVQSSSSLQYVEANGEIEFVKRYWKRGMETQRWRRQCKLQIAYSRSEQTSSQIQMDHSSSCAVDRIEEKRMSLPSLEEMTKLSNNLVPNSNAFGGYLRNFDFDAERKVFLEKFHAELSRKNAAEGLTSPRYVEDRLVFGKVWPRIKREFPKEEREGFLFNYEIHLIIYQGGDRARRDSIKDSHE